MEYKFLVRLNDSPRFLVEIRSGVPYGSPYPTRGILLTFDSATEICNRFREQGYGQPIVVDRFGQLPTAADLAGVKRSVEYQVMFAGRYFCKDAAHPNEDSGSNDRRDAVNMSQAAAIAVCERLKKKKHKDAVVIESSSAPAVDVNEELSKIWPEEFAS